jgi:hypothetical protein
MEPLRLEDFVYQCANYDDYAIGYGRRTTLRLIDDGDTV